MDQEASDGLESNRMRSMLQVEQSKGAMVQGAMKRSDGSGNHRMSDGWDKLSKKRWIRIVMIY
jgi:hypothetical protein